MNVSVTVTLKQYEIAVLLFALDALDRENGKALPQSKEVRAFIAGESKSLRALLHRADVTASMNQHQPTFDRGTIVPSPEGGGFAA